MNKDWPWLTLESPFWSNESLRPTSVWAIRAAIRNSAEVDAALEISAEDGYLEALRFLDDLDAAIKRERDLIVATARAKGVTWNAIARQLGCSRQAAQQRFWTTLPESLIDELDKEVQSAYRHAQFILRHQSDYSDDEFGEALDFIELFENLE